MQLKDYVYCARARKYVDAYKEERATTIPAGISVCIWGSFRSKRGESHVAQDP